MARRQTTPLTIDPEKGREGRPFLEAMASDAALDGHTRKRAGLILAMIGGATVEAAARQAGIGVATAREKVRLFNQQGWPALLTVMAPRGGDFLARYDQGYWAERLTRAYLDQSTACRAYPYGTSRSEPFTDMGSFRDYVQTEYRLQAWSAGAGGRWKRPDLLTIPREFIRQEAGNESWSPDLQHLDNQRCARYVAQAKAAIEVETSLWQVKKATVRLSFTVKEEDIEALRNWVRANNRIPLFIVQVFYDQAFALRFATLEEVIALPRENPRHVAAKEDRTTHKRTYMVPLGEGRLLGDIPEPDVEGKVFKAPNGKVTVYGRLSGSAIEPADPGVLEALATGTLHGGRDETAAAAEPELPEPEDGEEA